MRTLYFDCFSGISGDMTIGALIDVGADFAHIRSEIGKLGLAGVELRCSRVVRAGIEATKFDVVTGEGEAAPGDGHSHGQDHPHGHDHAGSHGPHRHASGILKMIRESGLSDRTRRRATAIFEKLAVAEGRVHGLPPEEVAFHEVGAIDSIVDVVGTAIALESLGVEECVSSPLNVGSGFVECQHGVYPVPAPATSNLLEGVPIYSRHVAAELVTPTGAAILAAMADRFEPLGDMTLERVGYGAGTRDHGRFPNCLRVFLGEGGHARGTSETVTVIETNIDDMSAGDLAWAAERLLAAGALDVVTLPALMKKGRPGHVLQVIGRPEDADRLARTVFAETTTIGLRTSQVARRVLDREIVEVPTRFGPVRVKVARTNGRVLNVSAEYEDCARLARQTGEPLRVIREETLGAYRARASDDDSGDNG